MDQEAIRAECEHWERRVARLRLLDDRGRLDLADRKIAFADGVAYGLHFALGDVWFG